MTRNEDGFNVVEEMPPSGWANHRFDDFGEYIHLVPATEVSELRCYRSVSDATEGNERIMMTVEDVNFKFYWEDAETELKYFYLTAQKAESFLTFIDLLEQGREGPVGLSWWEESGMKMMEREKTRIETLNLQFRKPDGVERRMQISSAWQHPTHKMAKIEGEGF